MYLRRFIPCGVCLVVFLSCAISYGRPGEEVVTGTTLIGEMVQQMTGSPEAMRNLLPPNLCPGHYDMRPGDIDAIASCRLLVLQPWQRNMSNMERVIKVSKIPEARVKVIPVPGNWMLPVTRIEATRAVSAVLSEAYPDRKEMIGNAANVIISDVTRVEAWGRAQFNTLSPATINVLCNEQQVDLARWAGLAVVQTYGRPENLSVAQIEALTGHARENKTALVIDNLQSGDTRMGEALARDTGAVHVVLSNFPGAEMGTATWEQTFRKNVERITTGITQWRRVHHE